MLETVKLIAGLGEISCIYSLFYVGKREYMQEISPAQAHEVQHFNT